MLCPLQVWSKYLIMCMNANRAQASSHHTLQTLPVQAKQVYSSDIMHTMRLIMLYISNKRARAHYRAMLTQAFVGGQAATLFIILHNAGGQAHQYSFLIFNRGGQLLPIFKLQMVANHHGAVFYLVALTAMVPFLFSCRPSWLHSFEMDQPSF